MQNERGNVLVFVLIGVALFAALTFTFMRGGQQGTGNLSAQQAKIAAGDILSYARDVETAVSRIRARRISESALDFENTVVSGYTNAACADDTCEIFDAAGGQMVWQAPPAKSNDGSAWIITGANRIQKIGTDGASANNAELSLVLPNVKKEVCVEINNRLGVNNPSGNPPQSASNVNYSGKFAGTFTGISRISGTDLDGKWAGCFEGNGVTPPLGTYHFYQVLLAR